MKIGLLIAFAGRNCGGPEVFEREIVRAMPAVAPQHEYHLYCLDRRASAVIDFKDERLIYHQLQPGLRVAAMLTSLPWTMSRTRPDVLYAPVIPPPFCPPNTIMSMPCSSLLHHPEFYPPLVRLRLRFLLHRAIRTAAKVICPSEQVRNAVLERLQVPAERLVVIHPGITPLFQPIDEDQQRAHVQERFGIQYPYFLFSGRWEHRKNLVRTLEAFARFKETYRTEHRFVVTGGRSWNSGEAQRVIHRLRLQDAVVDLGKTSVEELPYLYGGADALVYASLWEGFGLPIVEAMACGTPVITANAAAMPETAGGAALLVDPHSIEDIAAAMQRITSNLDLRKQLRERGLERAQLFSWEKTASRTAALYDEIAN
jgi:glycosyltransferase involved in cell wall biosynthesis